jgi:hypothetical protein
MTANEIKKAIATKTAELRALEQLSPAFEAKCLEIRALRAMQPCPLANIKPGVYFSGKGRKAFLVTA